MKTRIIPLILAAIFGGCIYFSPIRVVTDARLDPARLEIDNPTPFFGKIFAQADTVHPLCIIRPNEAVYGEKYLWLGYSALALVVPMYSDEACAHYVGMALATAYLRNGQFHKWTIGTVYLPDGTCRYYSSQASFGSVRTIEFPDMPNRTTVVVQIPNFTRHDACVIVYPGMVAEPWSVKRTWVRPGGFYAKEELVGYRPYTVSYTISVDYLNDRGAILSRRNLGRVDLYNSGPYAIQLFATPPGFKY
ncbi:hypothetical protein M1432_02580 [Patescibacteria group bacterium]|nr:hypothetical protein [Patescibacteria group bacterium]